MKTIEIVDKTNKVLFSHSKKDNTIADTLELGVMQGVNFSGAILDYATLRKSNFKGADLGCASLIGAKLEGSCLSGANLIGADLTDASLNYTNLKGANLSNATLVDSILVGANLEGVKLHGVNLRGADLDEAILTDVDYGKSLLSSNQTINNTDNTMKYLNFFLLIILIILIRCLSFMILFNWLVVPILNISNITLSQCIIIYIFRSLLDNRSSNSSSDDTIETLLINLKEGLRKDLVKSTTLLLVGFLLSYFI